MSDNERIVRRELLTFVERHWRELTLRDARSLCVEVLGSDRPFETFINESLTAC
jgi:hypothetical protein